MEDSAIKLARKEAGLSQAGVQTKLGIPVRTLQNWEEGTRTPPAWLEKLIIDALKK